MITINILLIMLIKIGADRPLSAKQGKYLNDFMQANTTGNNNATGLIVDELNREWTNRALSANQGKSLQDQITKIAFSTFFVSDVFTAPASGSITVTNNGYGIPSVSAVRGPGSHITHHT